MSNRDQKKWKFKRKKACGIGAEMFKKKRGCDMCRCNGVFFGVNQCLGFDFILWEFRNCTFILFV